MTLTLRHHQGDRLAPRLAAVAESLRSTLKGSGWERRRDRLGYVGSIKSVEITHGQNGWHPHSHSVMLFDRQLTDLEVADFERWLFGRWSAVVERKKFGSISTDHGVDVRPITDGDGIGRYVNKVEGGWTAGHELARGDRKVSSPIDLLVGFVETGETRLRDLWQEYEQATYGRRSLLWSRGLRSHLGLEVEEQTDEELAASEGADLTLLRAILDAGRWNKIAKAGATGELLTSIEEIGALLLFVAHATGANPQPLDLDDLDRPSTGRKGRSPEAGGPPPQPPPL